MEAKLQFIEQALKELSFTFQNNWPSPIKIIIPHQQCIDQHPLLQPYILPSVSRIELFEWLITLNKIKIKQFTEVSGRVQSIFIISNH